MSKHPKKKENKGKTKRGTKKSSKIQAQIERRDGVRNLLWPELVNRMGHGKVESPLTIIGVKANAGKNEVVHHHSGGKGRQRVNRASTPLLRAKKGNLRKMTAAQHNKMHPEKGRKAAAARKRKVQQERKQQGEKK